MGRRHHSFLDSLKDFGHKVENTVKSAAPQILSTVQTASKFTPVGIVASIATNPAIDKAVVGGFNKVGSSVKGALDNVKNEAVAIERGAVGLIKSGINEVQGGLSYIKYIPYVAGGVLAIWIYSKVK